MAVATKRVMVMVIGAAVENFLSNKNVFKWFFLSVQCCRYGVLYEYSSKKNFKKIILSCPKCL
jgi:hypothetical protein